MKKLLTAPLSWIYGLIISIRHKLFSLNILKSEEFDIPIVSIGNIAVGGTGKTPHTEYVVQMLSPLYNVAVLSRGYKRKTKGFVLATVQSPTKQIGDEPKQIKLKFPNIPVAVCEKRVIGIKELRKIHPDINLIILDDAFQHRYVEPWLSVVLMDYSAPYYEDHLLPMGRLRDLKSQISRANFIIVTKCPNTIKPIDMRVIMKRLNLFPYQSLFFTKMVSLRPVALYPQYDQPQLEYKQDAIAMAAIASAQPFIDKVQSAFNVIDTLIFRDHHTYTLSDISTLEKLLEKGNENTVIIVTEKDSVKLIGSKKIPENIKRRLYYIPIKVKLISFLEENCAEDFFQKTMSHVKHNQKYSLMH